jgi:heterodisulfide reductase subunit B
VEYPLKTACCGGVLSISKPAVGRNLIGDLLAAGIAADADCIVTACPLCKFNLDSFQKEAGKIKSTQFNIPVFFLAQLMGLAFGLPPKTLGLQRNIVSPDAVYKKIAAGAAVSSGEAVASGRR